MSSRWESIALRPLLPHGAFFVLKKSEEKILLALIFLQQIVRPAHIFSILRIGRGCGRLCCSASAGISACISAARWAAGALCRRRRPRSRLLRLRYFAYGKSRSRIFSRRVFPPACPGGIGIALLQLCKRSGLAPFASGRPFHIPIRHANADFPLCRLLFFPVEQQPSISYPSGKKHDGSAAQKYCLFHLFFLHLIWLLR